MKPPVTGKHISSAISTDKLDGSNYATWASNTELWLQKQGYNEHLTKKAEDVPEVGEMEKIDSQLFGLIKQAIHPSLKQILLAKRCGRKQSSCIPMMCSEYMWFVRTLCLLLLPRNLRPYVHLFGKNSSCIFSIQFAFTSA